jgi:osmotically-inducible protein OsmY
MRPWKHFPLVLWLAAATSVAIVLPACATTPAGQTRTQTAVSSSSSDEALKARVSGALAASSLAAAKLIAVDVSGGVVTLTGRVGDSYELQDVGALVRSVPGVGTVRFSVKVQPAGASQPQGR